MRNFTPDVHGEVHIRHLDTMQRGTDGPKNTLNGLVRTDIKFCSQMSVACAFNQTIVRDVFGGSRVRLNVSDTLSSKCRKVVFPDVLGWHYVGPTYATGDQRRRCNGYMIHEWQPSTYTATISAELSKKSRTTNVVSDFVWGKTQARVIFVVIISWKRHKLADIL